MFSFCIFQKFFQKWKARGSMKDRTSALHHQTIWTMVAPKTSPNSPQQTWRTWRSITISGRIQAATLHLERWWTREHVLFESRRKLQSCCRGFRRHWGGGFHLVLASFQKSQNCRTLMGGQEGDALQRRRFSSVADSSDTETVDAARSSFFFWDYRVYRLKDSQLADSRICMLCVCISYLKKKKKKKVAVAEPSVTFDVIEICLPFCHFCHSQPMYALIFLTESAS